MKKTKLLFAILLVVSSLCGYLYLNKNVFSKDVKSDNMAHVQMLISYDNWKEHGAFKSHLSQIDSYSGIGNHGFYYYPRLVGSNGTNYYVSCPSLSLMIPYFIAWVIQVEPDNLFIQIFSVVLHFISALFVFLLVNLINKKHIWSFSFESTIASITFLFYPILMYCFTVHYQHDVLSILLYIILMYLCYPLFVYNKISNLKVIILFTVVFSIVFTEWIGVLFVFVFVILNMIFKSLKNIKIILIVSLAAFLAILLMIIQYSLVNGVEAYLKAAFIRYIERSGVFPESYTDKGLNYYNLDSYYYLMLNIHNVLKGLGYFIICFSLFVLIYVINKKKTYKIRNLSFWILLIFPILICYILFFNVFVIHYANHSKLALLLPIILGVSVYHYMKIFKTRFSSRCGILGFIIVYVFVLIYSSNEYYQFIDKKNENNEYLLSVGNFIKQNSNNDEAVFISTNQDYSSSITYLSYISKKNIKIATDIEEAKNLAIKYFKPKGVLFTFEKEIDSFRLKHFEINE